MSSPHSDEFINELQRLSEKYKAYKGVLEPIINQLKQGKKSEVYVALGIFNNDTEWGDSSSKR